MTYEICYNTLLFVIMLGEKFDLFFQHTIILPKTTLACTITDRCRQKNTHWNQLKSPVNCKACTLVDRWIDLHTGLDRKVQRKYFLSYSLLADNIKYFPVQLYESQTHVKWLAIFFSLIYSL